MLDTTAATLIIESGDPDTTRFYLDRPVSVLGKGSDVDIPIGNPYVSRRHAEITCDQDRFRIRDLGSKNGTYINGKRLVRGFHQLAGGDRIELGLGRVLLKFLEPGSTLTQAEVHDLVVDSKSREVWFEGKLLKVTPKEYLVLEHLYARRGEACSKDDLAAAGWPELEGMVGHQDVEQIITRLRRRIEANSRSPQYILTVMRFGYKLSSR